MKHNKRIWTLLATMAAASAPAALLAAPLSLAQSPPGAATEPAPNIIVSVDDSGSMGWDLNGCPTQDFAYSDYNGLLFESGSSCYYNSTKSTDNRYFRKNPNTSRIRALKNALISTFGDPAVGTKGIVSDNRIRLAWQSMWDNGQSARPSDQQNDQDQLTPGQINSIKWFSGAHRTNFGNFVNTLKPYNGTPSHKMLRNVTGYMSSTGINSPFANEPGKTGTDEASCRRNYHVFMTDGAWNNETGTRGNADGTARTLGDGTTAYSQTNQTRAYWDSHGGITGTLADLAFHNWATDFRTLPNDVRPLLRINTPETVDTTILQPFWNPKNNPMTWQGVTQYSIGFGNSATTWTGNPTWDNATDNTYGGGYSDLINGIVTWQNPSTEALRPMDLWHMALNGRGKYFPARTEGALTNAFRDILSDILEQTANPLVSIASSSSRLRADGFVYVAGFNSEGWSGELGAYNITAGTNKVSPNATWKATSALDSAGFDTTNRLVLTHNGTTGTTFVWTNLSPNDKTALQGGDTATVGENRVNYLRGVRSFEVANGGTMRNRSSRLGDIVNSNIWNTRQPLRMAFEHTGHAAFRTTINALNSKAGRAPALYVGANDGMLHAFNADNGQELFAYVPRAMYATLRDYTLPNYGHKFYVDGNPFTGDAVTSGTTWSTVLVSGLGGGGRGYFVLDVTNPATLNAASVLIDKTVPGNTPAAMGDPVENDIGHIYAQPVLDYVSGTRSEQIVKLNNGRWAVVMGNGVNSVNERPVLLIQYLDGTRGIDRIVADATTGGSNGLSAPRLVDINGDGTMDLAYAGDLQGNLWKFNLMSTTASDWGVSSWSATAGAATCKAPSTCVPLMVAKNSGDTRQPITASPLWISNPTGGIQLLFGTGRNLTEADRSDASIQTIYSVLDKSTYETVLPVPPSTTRTLRAKNESGANITASNARTRLVEQTVVSQVGSTNYFNTSEKDVDYGPVANKRGWYFDLPASREKVLFSPQFFEGQKVIVGTNVPKMGSSGETCDFSSTEEDNWINVFNMITGKPSTSPVWASTDGSLDKATRTKFGAGEYVSINKSGGGMDLISFKNDDPTCPPGELCTEQETLQSSRVPGARADWREVR